jgi:hypothetical protein
MSRYTHFTKLKHLIFPNGGSTYQCFPFSGDSVTYPCVRIPPGQHQHATGQCSAVQVPTQHTTNTALSHPHRDHHVDPHVLRRIDLLAASPDPTRNTTRRASRLQLAAREHAEPVPSDISCYAFLCVEQLVGNGYVTCVPCVLCCCKRDPIDRCHDSIGQDQHSFVTMETDLDVIDERPTSLVLYSEYYCTTAFYRAHRRRLNCAQFIHKLIINGVITIINPGL